MKRTELEGIVRLGHIRVGFKSSNVVNIKSDRLAIALLARTLARLLAFALRLLEVGLVDREAELLGHQEGQVDGEAVSVVQAPYIGAGELLGS